jgi:hypothetical protein
MKWHSNSFSLLLRMIRERRRYTLGRWFDVGKFHIDVLACLGPLDNLEECIVLQVRRFSTFALY